MEYYIIIIIDRQIMTQADTRDHTTDNNRPLRQLNQGVLNKSWYHNTKLFIRELVNYYQ